MTETVLTNARLILDDEVISGTVVFAEGSIVSVETGSTRVAGAVDCDGDLVMPGLVELHTDNLERHIQPRPAVDWPHAAAILAHDRELASCGITTVFDALRVGTLRSSTGVGYGAYARALATEILAMRAAGALKISHHLHLRAEICSQNLVDELDSFAPEDRVGLVSLMDHTPGQRQFADTDKLRAYIQGKKGLSADQFDIYCEELRGFQAAHGAAHEAAAVAAARRLGAALASHDDTTEGQVATSAGHGVALAEFPTTVEAARACRAHGVAVMMGAPNVIRGGSHSGNVAAMDLAEAGLLDILSSDYVPAALLLAAMRLGERSGDMAAAVATVTAAPARAVGLTDRGRIAPGLRADLIRVRMREGFPGVEAVWSEGARVA
ncbi:alpha-D-ribose 1-methylphosphonate 5-triphosphate diphosphatase [Jannaschia seohaensis]|uniref:Alpha-D-ribose 1-methylphosphonate 5-triphosphate diphosphatase n=1 Tax=Jannaschia seohaensis TaxID=475081 RepID=A0A2Y9A145_9RHOB|nr:alpha-D-ribose 1-methylphosphonate 5-triphosphate diphosphatase [Jannaschia seohaensis]PWJ21892.1 alpha-D-ribose 1-methylphosphonate 5-triphosphate diphosphatase [Jannaschia seohaensis]SSA38170.1 alpha-D-ribose 1-methylphosphonate 5-triphosphate diphosphatase [Jannaschia seohaensis]